MTVCTIGAALHRVSTSKASATGDPHPGNLLCSCGGGGPVPILLDFGLTKRLTETQRIAFCRLVHGMAEGDGDLLFDALAGLGFVFNVAFEPHEVRLPSPLECLAAPPVPRRP